MIKQKIIECDICGLVKPVEKIKNGEIILGEACFDCRKKYCLGDELNWKKNV